MRITKQEVKTNYSIEFTVEDFKKVIEYGLYETYMSDELKEYLEKNDISKDSLVDENVQCLFKRWNFNCELLRLVASYFGFDGVDHFGSYNQNKKVRTLTVYNYGDYINK